VNERTAGLPHIVQKKPDEAIECRALDPMPLLASELNEAWLQEVLEKAPGLLPIAEIDDRVQPPLFSLGCEISTPAGSIDNLFISASGHLVVVETKLWRNPEARRKVVAQILDYATHVRRWNYSILCKLTKKTNIWEMVSPDVAEHDWIDQVNANLAAGRITLVVVGDGIRSEAKALVDMLASEPAFPFRLALVRLQIFRDCDGRHLVVPSTLAKTVEVERAIVQLVPSAGTAAISIQAPVARAESDGRSALSEQQFREQLRAQPDGHAVAQVADRLLGLLQAPRDRSLQVSWHTHSFTVKMLEPSGSGRMLSLCVVTDAGTASVVLDWLTGQLEQVWTNKDSVKRVCEAYAERLLKMGAVATPSGRQFNFKLTSLVGKEERFVADLDEVASLIQRYAAADP